ncbi:hypothetical protein LOC69_23845 [Blastopirellula sp. JC733]|nr:hypothetical protein [Blastopirellula sediminis]
MKYWNVEEKLRPWYPMKFYGVTKISCFIDNPRIKSFHANMFHGLAERDGKEFPGCPPVYANTESPSLLTISRNASRVPKIFQPMNHLVVHESYEKTLSELPNIRLAPVEFRRLVDVEFAEGDMSWAEKWGNVDPCQLLRTLPDVPEFHQTIGRYIEVQCYRNCDAAKKYPTASPVTIVEGTPPWEEKSEMRLSAEMLEQFPIMCGSLIVSAPVYELLKEGLDPTYFVVREFDLDSCHSQ